MRTILLLAALASVPAACSQPVQGADAAPAPADDLVMSPPDAAVPPDAAMAGRDYSSDRGRFFGTSRCAQAGVQLCEDFESGALDPGTWAVTGTRPVIDGLQHARGSKALHITVNGNGPSYIKETRTFPAMNN